MFNIKKILHTKNCHFKKIMVTSRKLKKTLAASHIGIRIKTEQIKYGNTKKRVREM